jgi:ubiquinone/menaquinone biosynthesis C-methylase UbiE
MHPFQDQQYLKTDQYRDDRNLRARVELHARFSTGSPHWLEWVFDRLLRLPSAARILEVGCGPGTLWALAKARVPSGWQITLTDLSLGMLKKAVAVTDGCGNARRFVLCDAQALTFRDGSYDAVIADHMLYHVPNLDRALIELHRVLRPGGQLFAATNGESHLRELLALGDAHQMPYSPVRSFSLENGAVALSRHFADVTCERHVDGLRVTQAEPLLGYLRSMPGMDRAPAEEWQRLRTDVERQIQRDGAVSITKDAGLFCARRAPV